MSYEEDYLVTKVRDLERRLTRVEAVLGSFLEPADQGVSAAVEATEAPEQEAVPPYVEWTNAELRDELTARGLPTGGDKATMADRLTQNDQS